MIPIQKPSLLIVGHTYGVSENRKKIEALASWFELTCVVPTPPQYALFGKEHLQVDLSVAQEKPTYRLIRLPQKGSSTTCHFLAGLKHVFRKHPFEVVLVENEPWAFNLWQTRLLASLIQPQAKFAYFTWENVKRPGLKGGLLSAIYRVANRASDFVIAGNLAAKEIVKGYGKAEEEILVAPQLGVDPRNHLPADRDEKEQLRIRFGLSKDAFLIGFCGRFVHEKGIWDLIHACEKTRWQEMQISGKRGDIRLALLGGGPLLSDLQDAMQSRKWLSLHEPVPHHEIPQFLRMLDLFVLPSVPRNDQDLVWEEQFGHVLIEAMACGVPTLGSSSGAIPEVIGDEQTLFSPKDSDGLSRLLAHWIQNPEKLNCLALSQRDRVLEKFTHEQVALQWADFIKVRLISGEAQDASTEEAPR